MSGRRCCRGTTVIEVMMALAVLAIGASGIMALQKLTIVANRDGRNLEIATEIARTWLDRMRADALLWNDPSDTTLSRTVYLKGHVTDPTQLQWFRPLNATLGASGVHDALGLDAPNANDGPFCANVRLSWLRGSPPAGRVIRVEVRVYWLRQGAQFSGTQQVLAKPLCGTAADNPPDVQANTEIYHFVNMTTGLVVNPIY